MSDWQQSQFPGVRYREHPTRRVSGKPDKYYTIRFRVSTGNRKEESLGWASEGWTPAKAYAELVNRIRGKSLVLKPDTPTQTQTQQLRVDQKAPVSQQQVESKLSPMSQPLSTKVQQAADLFIEWAKVNKKSWSDDQQRLRKHVLPVLGPQELSSVGFPEIESLKLRCQTKGLAPATVVQCLAVTRSVFNFAAKMRLYSGSNPVNEVKFPKVNNRRLRFLTQQEARWLLETAASYNRELHDMCLLCLYTGMRAGEMTALRWFDVDFHHDLIAIRDGKNDDARQVFMVDNVKSMLQKRKKSTPGSLIFPSGDGRQRVRVSKMFLRLTDKLGLNKDVADPRQKVCFHTLRHSFASWLALQGETLLTIKELMGHKTITMTMRYAHLIPDQKRSAVERLASLASNEG